MKRLTMCGFVGLMVLGVSAGAARAAAPAGAGPRAGLVEAGDLSRLSIGADMEWLRRRVDVDGIERNLDARRTGLFLGWNAAPWLDLFATGGRDKARLATPYYDDPEWRWSVGANARLWHTDIVEPSFVAGRLALDATVEYSHTPFDEGWGQGQWDEEYLAVTVAYELFVETIESPHRVPFSLRLYVGPAISRLDGEVPVANVESDFSETREVGIVSGVELYASHNLSVGYSAQRFERTTSLATLRYRF